ncbi:MAG: C-GCAxxG-C-C family (seleno)protein [Desulfovibrio sp.]
MTSDIQARTLELFNSGYHCAESIAISVSEALEMDTKGTIPRMATPFGGGIGKTLEGPCGGFTGGLLILGLLDGRDKNTTDWEKTARLTRKWENTFHKLEGHLYCKNLLDKFGVQQNNSQCKKLVARAAEELYNLLKDAK